MILACAKKYGNCWGKNDEIFTCRYSDAICFRYDGYLDLSLKHTEWSDVEIIRLLRLVKQYGYDKKYGKWNYILKEMSGRGRAECYRQAKRLFHLNPDLEKNMIYNIDELQKPKWEKQNANFSLQRQEVRKTAVETLNSALEKIFPTLNEKVDLETLDLSSNDGVIILKKINAELFKDWDEKKFTVLQPRYCIKNPEDTEIQIEDTERGSESNLENDENTEKETNLNKKEKEVRTLKVREFKVLRLDKNEKNWIHKVLQTKIQEIADFRFLLPYDSDEMDLSLSASAESSIYQNYLQQQFSCSSNEDIEFVCNEVDYNISVPDIIRHFIQPPCPESQMAVLSPNLATLGGMVNILASRRMLRRTANFVDHSIPYLRYSFGLTEDRPQCIKCCAVETAIECGEKFVAVVNKMKSNYIYPSEEMKNAAMVETKNSAIQNEECCCNELATSKDEVDLLIKRFMSLFLWPFLLSSSELSTEQELIISNIQDSETEETESEENSVDEESSSQSSVEPTRKKEKLTRRKNIKISKLRSTNLLQRRQRSCVKQKPPPCITISDSDEIEIFFCRMESEENSVDEENINQCCVKPPRKKKKTTLRKNIKNIKTKLRSTNLLQRRRRSCVKQKPPPCIAISDSDEIEIVFEA
ncbi:snRNA-activating protein complex subunit 4, partial [Caerostris extrusa]